MTFTASLDEGLGFRVPWNNTILLDESHKLEPRPLNESQRPKSVNSRLNLHGTILEAKSIGSNPPKKKDLKAKARDLKNQDVS
jgi:hypothetical protein